MILESLFGSLVGIVGSGVTAFANYKTSQLQAQEREAERKFELAKIEAETKAMIAESEASIKVAQVTYRGQTDVEEAKAFTESQKEAHGCNLDNGVIVSMYDRGPVMAWLAAILTFLLGLCDVLKGLMRPALTIYVMLIASWVTYESYEIFSAFEIARFDAQEAWVSWKSTVDFILLLASTLISWWFGDRRLTKFMMQQKASGQR
jgi:hypothetical protein